MYVHYTRGGGSLMQQEMRQRQELSLRQRFRTRLYEFAREDIKLSETLLTAVAINRVVLILYPPFELSVFGFYIPLINRVQLWLWLLLGTVMLIGRLGRHPMVRVVGLIGSTALWAFAAVMTFMFAESKQLAISPTVFSAFSFAVLLRLGVEWPRTGDD